MVEQSELPFRLLCRDYNIPLCYSPMINGKHFVLHPKYAKSVFQTCPTDRPLIAQLCGHNPDDVLAAALKIQHQVDAVDLNFGCPQHIARRGNYGAFLLTQVDTMCALVHKLHTNLSIPVCAKIRVVKDEAETLRICRLLRQNGVSILTVHGRTIDAKKTNTGDCDFEIIRKIKQSMDIPVFANGGCETMDDVIKCLEITGCDGYMAAESILANPAMFVADNAALDAFQMSRDYIAHCKVCADKYGWSRDNKFIAMKGHLIKVLYRELTIFQDLRNQLGFTKDVQWIWSVVDLLQARRKNMEKNLYQFIYDKFTVNWYHRHWKAYEKLRCMDTWDLIVNECSKPMEEHEDELIELMIKHNVLSIAECENELKLSESRIMQLMQSIARKEELEALQKERERNSAANEAHLINAMFGDDGDESDDVLEVQEQYDDDCVSTTESEE
eukprot:CAMPEP_0197039748 /NCGR_PEP_ID=MMETSP1384-20130603/16526_1 /TAXON_ID=29189 /ORGANISM="Ammonia sp." /LENGTH=442 /DNA_ID=CAMNT_0042470393 /DNA_START=66 /DNA_END=1391 /DNA_ORIENTATION=+